MKKVPCRELEKRLANQDLETQKRILQLFIETSVDPDILQSISAAEEALKASNLHQSSNGAVTVKSVTRM